MTDVAARAAAAAWLAGEVGLAPLGQGHINDTWLVQAAAGRFVLQRVSQAVFPDPLAVARKVERVADHLRGIRQVGVPDLLRTPAGAGWHLNPAGSVWRLWAHVGGSRTLEALTSEAEAQAAGAAFGRFQRAVADLPGVVEDPIPGFLQLPGYLADLDAVVAARPPDGEAEAALAMVTPRRDLATGFAVRDRLIHGDCKINNLLFHGHRREVTHIIDLDTVMQGNWAWDFGDLARSAAADGARVNVARFAAIARGFVQSAELGPGLDERVGALVLAPRYVALMLGVRFLTDHLRGDRYFKVRARGDNLGRGLQQLRLVEDLERRERAMGAAARRI